MSSFPLISHHLFVAAVNEKPNWWGIPDQGNISTPPPDIRVREVPVELIDFGRPLPTEAYFPFAALGQPRPKG